jgi:signal transduction histidine kinase
VRGGRTVAREAGAVVTLPRTLSTRIAILAGVLTLGGAVTHSFILIRSQRHSVLEEVVHGSQSLAEAVLIAMRHETSADPPAAIAGAIEAVGGQAGVARVRLIDKRGEISYSSRAAEIGLVVDRSAEGCIQCHRASDPFERLDQDDRSRIHRDAEGGGRVLSTIASIENAPGCATAGCHVPPARMSVLGVLDVTVSLAPVDARLAATTRDAVLLSIVAVLIISVALFFLIQQVVRQPIGRLVAATRRVAGGDFALPRLASGATDEIGFLARSFNEMIESVQTSQQDLEQKVAEKAEELRAAQFQVVQAEKLSSVGLVAAGIAHELNSPLMAIVTFAHLVERRLPPGSQENEDIRMIMREADRCAAIIRTLLDFSRDQSEASELELTDVRTIIERATKILGVELRNHGIELVATASALPPIEANPVQITQVLVNLLINALHAMPDGGRITIDTDIVSKADVRDVRLPPSGGDTLVRLRVRDTGTGIAPDVLGRVFDPFFTTKPVGQGSGLGLSVSHAILQRHRGAIFAHSDGATWTEFTILLPAATTAAEVPP